MKKIFCWKTMLILAILLFLVIIGLSIWSSMYPTNVYKFNLAEIENGVFAYRETVVSSIPADNYTMVTVCDTSGNIFTMKGTVKIVNSYVEVPYAIFEDFNVVNADVITLYVPANTIRYLGTVSSGRK